MSRAALPPPPKPREKKPRADETRKRAPGGGRKKGIKATLTAEIAQDATLSGVTPVEILLHHARYSHQRAIVLATEFEQQVVDLATTDPEELKDATENAKIVMRNMMDFSENACRYASLAAPYCHPRLNSIAFTDPKKATASFDDGKVISQEEASQIYRKMIK